LRRSSRIADVRLSIVRTSCSLTHDFDHLDNETFARLRSQLMRFAADNAEALAKATPEIPPGFHNRRRANWVPLLAIAEAAGGEWKTAAWKAARAIEAIADTFDPSIGVELLRAIKAAFKARENQALNKDRITAPGLNDVLIADETAPWATYNKGKPISQAQVKNLLKPYGIKPKTIRWDDGTEDGSYPKGYLLEWFTDVFDRFCTSSSPQTPDSSFHTSTDLFSHNNSTSTSAPNPPHAEAEKSFDNNGVEMWKSESGGGAEKRHSGGSFRCVRTAGSKSDDLLYTGPVVGVPDLGPDDLDAHGRPRAEHTHVCAQCHRDPPDGKEKPLAYGDETVWLHAECERFFIKAKMEEQGIPW